MSRCKHTSRESQVLAYLSATFQHLELQNSLLRQPQPPSTALTTHHSSSIPVSFPSPEASIVRNYLCPFLETLVHRQVCGLKKPATHNWQHLLGSCLSLDPEHQHTGCYCVLCPGFLTLYRLSCFTALLICDQWSLTSYSDSLTAQMMVSIFQQQSIFKLRYILFF